MKNPLIFTAGYTPAAGYARQHLEALDLAVTNAPTPDVTHLLLDIPSFQTDGALRGGEDLQKLLDVLPSGVTVCGGKLTHPALSGYKTFDLLQDPSYLAENAYITAEAALNVALPRLPCLLRGCGVLVIGWGRIGKCLARLLKSMDASVTVAARKEHDRAILRALGCKALDIPEIAGTLHQYRLIFNTVPQMLLPESSMDGCRKDCVNIDLASQPGMAGPDIITARGLPAIHKSESSGVLIAKTLLRFVGKETGL